LELADITAGNEEGKTSPMADWNRLLNFADAANTGFGRWMYGGAPNIAEFGLFCAREVIRRHRHSSDAPTLTPTFISERRICLCPECLYSI